MTNFINYLCPAITLSGRAADRLTWTQIHQCVVWCCPDESDVGSCICHGPPSHSQRGSGHWGSFCSHLQLQPVQCSGTEREHKHTQWMKSSFLRLFKRLFRSLSHLPSPLYYPQSPSENTLLSTVIKSIFLLNLFFYATS